MPVGTLSAALEQEHHDIDQGLESFVAGLAAGERRTDALNAAISSLRRHIYLEEEFLFPSLRAGGFVAPVFVMIREHGEIWRSLDALEADVAANTATAATADVCRTLASQLESHNGKEEQILYPQADRVLTAPASGELGAFMQTGQMPEGWVCAGARS